MDSDYGFSPSIFHKYNIMKKIDFNHIINEDFDFGDIELDDAASDFSQSGVAYACLQQNQEQLIEQVLLPGVQVVNCKINDNNSVSARVTPSAAKYSIGYTLYQILIKNGYHSCKTIGFEPGQKKLFKETCPDVDYEKAVDIQVSYDEGCIVVIPEQDDRWQKRRVGSESVNIDIYYTGKKCYTPGEMTFPKNSPEINRRIKALRFINKVSQILNLNRIFTDHISGIKFEDNIPVFYGFEDCIYLNSIINNPHSQRPSFFKISRSKMPMRGIIVGIKLLPELAELYKKYVNRELSLNNLYKEFSNDKLRKEQSNNSALTTVQSGSDTTSQIILSNMQLPIKKIYKELFGGSCPVPVTTIENLYGYGPVYCCRRKGVSVQLCINGIGRSTDTKHQAEPNIGYTIPVADYIELWGLPEMDYETEQKLDTHNQSAGHITGCKLTPFNKMPGYVQDVYKKFSDVRAVVISPDDGIVMFMTGSCPVANARKYMNDLKKSKPEFAVKHYLDEINNNNSYTDPYTKAFILKFTGAVDYNKA